MDGKRVLNQQEKVSSHARRVMGQEMKDWDEAGG